MSHQFNVDNFKVEFFFLWNHICQKLYFKDIYTGNFFIFFILIIQNLFFLTRAGHIALSNCSIALERDGAMSEPENLKN